MISFLSDWIVEKENLDQLLSRKKKKVEVSNYMQSKLRKENKSIFEKWFSTERAIINKKAESQLTEHFHVSNGANS